jgi:hypothetical protein
MLRALAEFTIEGPGVRDPRFAQAKHDTGLVAKSWAMSG